MRSVLLIIGVLIAIVLFSLLIYKPRNMELGEVTMGGLGLTDTMGMLYHYGDAKGIFEEHGLNVTYVSFTDPYTATLALLTSKIDVFFTSPGLTAYTLDQGGSLRIGMAVAWSEQAFLTRPGIKTAEDLRGKSLGVIGITSDSYYITKWWLESKGIDMESDISVVEIKNPASLASYYQTGQLDSIIIWGSFTQAVKDSGGSVLVTQTECLEDLIGHPYYVPIALLSEDLVDQKPSSAKNLMRAFRDITRQVESDKEGAANYLADLTGEPFEIVMANIEMRMIGDLTEEIEDDLVSYFEYAKERGFISETPSPDIFYDEWRG